MATRSVSGAASTVRHTSDPIRPRAPSTPTRIGWAATAVWLVVGSVMRYRLGEVLREVMVVEGPDDAQRHRLAQQLGGYRTDVVHGDRVDLGEQLVDLEHVTVEQLALADPAHPGAGVLQPEHGGALEHALAAGHLGVGEPLGGDRGQLVADQV